MMPHVKDEALIQRRRRRREFWNPSEYKPVFHSDQQLCEVEKQTKPTIPANDVTTILSILAR